MKELYMLHQQELDERERVEHLDREAAYFAEINTPRKPGESHKTPSQCQEDQETNKKA